MLDVYLTDVQEAVQFKDYPGGHPVKFILNLKKIFPSVMELLLPILPENENLDEMKWEATSQDFDSFRLLLSGWGVIELRLVALSKFKDKNFADKLVRQAQQRRKECHKLKPSLSNLELDYIFMHEMHALIDAELIEVGEKFYLPTLRQLWKDKISDAVIEAKM